MQGVAVADFVLERADHRLTAPFAGKLRAVRRAVRLDPNTFDRSWSLLTATRSKKLVRAQVQNLVFVLDLVIDPTVNDLTPVMEPFAVFLICSMCAMVVLSPYQ